MARQQTPPPVEHQQLTRKPVLSPVAIWQDFRRYRHAYSMAATASFGGMFFGWDTGLIGGVLVEPSFKLAFGLDHKSKSELATLSGNIVSVLQAGCFFGALSSFFFSSKTGRKTSLFISIWIFFVGSIIQTCSGIHSKSLVPLYIGRAIGGFGVGLTSAVVPTYIAESAPTEIRGRCTGSMQLLNVSGIMLAFWVNYGLQQNTKNQLSSSIWRTAFALQLLPAVVMHILLFFQDESPRYLAEQGRWEEARRVMIRMRGGREHEIEKEFQGMLTDVAGMKKLTWKQQGKKVLERKMIYRALMGIIVMFFQQWTGTNSINVYAPQIFATLGFSSSSSSLFATGIYGVVKVICTGLGLALAVEQAGRKRSLIFPSLGQAISMYYLGAYRKLHPGNDRVPASYAAIVFVYLYAVFYSLGWGTVPWMIATEVIPTNLRPFTASWALMCQWLFNFVIVRLTPTLLDKLDYGTFLLFGTMCVIMTIWVLLGLPETKGVPLEDMDDLFSGSIIMTSLRDNPGSALCGFKREKSHNVKNHHVEQVDAEESHFDELDSAKKSMGEEELVENMDSKKRSIEEP